MSRGVAVRRISVLNLGGAPMFWRTSALLFLMLGGDEWLSKSRQRGHSQNNR